MYIYIQKKKKNTTLFTLTFTFKKKKITTLFTLTFTFKKKKKKKDYPFKLILHLL